MVLPESSVPPTQNWQLKLRASSFDSKNKEEFDHKVTALSCHGNSCMLRTVISRDEFESLSRLLNQKTWEKATIVFIPLF